MFAKFAKWKKHHQIEMFGIATCLLCIILFVNCFTISVYSHGQERDFLSTKAIYTPNFKTSLSDIGGQVQQVFVNADKTKCGIMLHMDNMLGMSTDAKDYQVFVKGYNISKQRYAAVTYNQPNGGIYIFGSTGYIMIYMVDNAGWYNQALEIVVRSHKTLQNNAQNKDLTGVDISYSQYDQFNFLINPAGAEAVVCDFFDGDTVDVTALYQETVLREVEENQREILKQDIIELNTYASQIAAYYNALKTVDVNIKPLPACMDGDGTAFVNDEVTGELRYYPTTIIPGGTDFDWYDTDLRTASYLDMVIGDSGLTRSGYFDTLAQDKINYGNTVETLNTQGWRRTNGTDINVEDFLNSPIDENKQIAQNIRAYVDAVNGFINVKKKYQTEDLVGYLYIQYNMEISGQTFSANLQEDTIHPW